MRFRINRWHLAHYWDSFFSQLATVCLWWPILILAFIGTIWTLLKLHNVFWIVGFLSVFALFLAGIRKGNITSSIHTLSVVIFIWGGFASSIYLILSEFAPIRYHVLWIIGAVAAGYALSYYIGGSFLTGIESSIRRLGRPTLLRYVGVCCMLFMLPFGVTNLSLEFHKSGLVIVDDINRLGNQIIGMFEHATSTSPNTSQKFSFQDDFTQNRGWVVLGQQEEISEWLYENGEYSGLAKLANSSTRSDIRGPVGLRRDFSVEVDVRDISGLTDSAAGIIFRAAGTPLIGSRYGFVIRNDGSYSIRKSVQGERSILQDWTVSGYINRGGVTNHLKVVARGANMEFYANGQRLTTITDTSLGSGYIALGIETHEQSNAHYHFDNFRLYSLD